MVSGVQLGPAPVPCAFGGAAGGRHSVTMQLATLQAKKPTRWVDDDGHSSLVLGIGLVPSIPLNTDPTVIISHVVENTRKETDLVPGWFRAQVQRTQAIGGVPKVYCASTLLQMAVSNGWNSNWRANDKSTLASGGFFQFLVHGCAVANTMTGIAGLSTTWLRRNASRQIDEC